LLRCLVYTDGKILSMFSKVALKIAVNWLQDRFF
jgi:hypothetical protein